MTVYDRAMKHMLSQSEKLVEACQWPADKSKVQECVGGVWEAVAVFMLLTDENMVPNPYEALANAKKVAALIEEELGQ